MGIDITRLQQKKADGSYDIVHPETQAKAVWMSDGRSVEEAVGAGGSGGGAGLLRVVVEADTTFNITNGEVTFTTPTVSHTFQQIEDAMNAGKIIDALLTGSIYYTDGNETQLGARQDSIIWLEAVTHYAGAFLGPAYGSAWFSNSACTLEIYDDGTPPTLRSNI